MLKIKNYKNLTTKKFQLFSLIIAAFTILTVFTGCKKNDDEPIITPALLVITSPNEGESKISGSNVTLAFNINASNGIKRLVIKYKQSGGTEIVKLDSTITAQPNTLNFSRSYVVGPIGTETYTISITDKNDNIDTKAVNIKSITGFAEETFGKLYHILGSNSGAFDLSESAQRQISDADGSKDMANTDANAVFTGSFESKNTTMFVKSLTFNYSSGSIIEAEKAYAAGTPDKKITNPIMGDIYIAKLRNSNTYVIIKVISNDALNNDCGCSNKGKLTFNLKKSL